MQTKLLINGKLVAGEGKVEEVLNPATGKVIALTLHQGGRDTRAPRRP